MTILQRLRDSDLVEYCCRRPCLRPLSLSEPVSGIGRVLAVVWEVSKALKCLPGPHQILMQCPTSTIATLFCLSTLFCFKHPLGVLNILFCSSTHLCLSILSSAPLLARSSKNC